MAAIEMKNIVKKYGDGFPADEDCADGQDNDCDGDVDAADSDCAGPPVMPMAELGDPCGVGALIEPAKASRRISFQVFKPVHFDGSP